MTPTEQNLQKQIDDLKFIINQFVRPDRYDFRKTISTATGGKIGFFGAEPIVKPSSTGEGTGANLSGTTVGHTSTFTGNNGSTAYTISDVIKHLKNLGILTK